MPIQQQFETALRAVVANLPLPFPANIVAELRLLRSIAFSNGSGILHQPLDDIDNDVVALEDGSDAADLADTFQIDDELMLCVEVISNNNFRVRRAQHGSAIAAHAAGATVTIGPPDLRPDVRDFLRSHQTVEDSRKVMVTYSGLRFT